MSTAGIAIRKSRPIHVKRPERKNPRYGSSAISESGESEPSFPPWDFLNNVPDIEYSHGSAISIDWRDVPPYSFELTPRGDAVLQEDQSLEIQVLFLPST